MTDKRFARSVVYLCAHSAKGAMGLIINQRADHISFPELLQQLDIVKTTDKKPIVAELLDRHVHVGGPVETGRGFVLHGRRARPLDPGPWLCRMGRRSAGK
jgi:putative transcriptional regulator